MDNVIAVNFGVGLAAREASEKKNPNPNPKPCDKCHRRFDSSGRENNCMCGHYRVWFSREWNRVCAPFRAMRDNSSEANRFKAETN